MTKLTSSQIQRLTDKILFQWKSQNLITLKADEKVILQAIKDAILKNISEEQAIEKEAQNMLLAMEQQGQEFQKGKMFHLLKQKIAKEKKFIL